DVVAASDGIVLGEGDGHALELVPVFGWTVEAAPAQQLEVAEQDAAVHVPGQGVMTSLPLDLLEGAGIVVLDAHPVAGHEVVEAAKGAPGRPHAHGVASEPDDVGWSTGDGGGDQLLRVQVALSAGCAHDDPDMGVALF